jgi:uncharacterized protein YjbJ (UPF0337 family)
MHTSILRLQTVIATVAQKVKEVSEDIVQGSATGKAAELTGQAAGKAQELSGKAKGAAHEAAGKASGATEEVKRRL